MPKMSQHYRALYDADYWGAWDLEDGDRTVTIRRCIGGELTGPGGKKSKKPVLYVEGSEKGIPLNKTNGKTIAALYGNYVSEWVGKKITLYKSSTRNPQDGGEIDCIRIRPVVPGSDSFDDAPITADQVDELDKIATDSGIGVDALLKRAEVATLGEIQAADFDGALKWLRREAAKRQSAAEEAQA